MVSHAKLRKLTLTEQYNPEEKKDTGYQWHRVSLKHRKFYDASSGIRDSVHRCGPAKNDTKRKNMHSKIAPQALS